MFTTGSPQNITEDSFPEESKYGHVDLHTRALMFFLFTPVKDNQYGLILLSFQGHLVPTEYKDMPNVGDTYAQMLLPPVSFVSACFCTVTDNHSIVSALNRP